MHELSITMGIVDAAVEESQRRGVQVSAVHLKLGALSGVVKDALLFSYEVACQDTPLAGSRLIVEDVPVIIFCGRCHRCNCFSVRNVVRRRWMCGKARSLRYLRSKY
jgi:hydrogenase nickel incorporation protein HypA/HybF